MGLITITNIEDGQDAVANALNERFGKIVGVLNGNIDSQNLKASAVTREKIAPQSVTSDKLSITKELDENGWLVTDYGTTQDYSYRKTGVLSIPKQTWVRVEVPLPADITSINDCFISMAPYSDLTEAIFTIVPDAGTDKIYINVFNAHTAYNATNVDYRIDFSVKRT